MIFVIQNEASKIENGYMAACGEHTKTNVQISTVHGNKLLCSFYNIISSCSSIWLDVRNNSMFVARNCLLVITIRYDQSPTVELINLPFSMLHVTTKNPNQEVVNFINNPWS